jgi:hypothetical protein
MLNLLRDDVTTKREGGSSATSPRARVEAERVRSLVDDLVKVAGDDVASEVVTLTPALAAELLSRNPANRPISQSIVDRYVRDIRAGRWSLNGEPVIISNDGLLNDGQHRCAAVVEANKPIQTLLVVGVRRDSRMTLDQGNVRTSGHYLQMSGHPDSNNLAAAANFVWQYRECGQLVRGGLGRANKSEVLQTVEHYKSIADSVRKISSNRSNLFGGRSLLAFCHWAISQRAGEAAADAFFKSLIDGANLATKDPILVCRNRLLERGRMYPNERAELIFRAWNAHRRRQSVSKIQVMGGKLPVLAA